MGGTLTLKASPTVAADEWALMREQASVLVSTGFLPVVIKTPEQAVAVMLKGRELGVPPMYALSNIAVINGKPVCTAELMLALIYRDHGDSAIVFTETSATRAVISYKRRGWHDRRTFAFSLDDARTAQLTGQTWQRYPAPMLRARCVSGVARLAFPDTIGGMYTPEELGAAVHPETGEILGNGHLDELEVDTVPGARLVRVDQATGELLGDGDLPTTYGGTRTGPVVYDDTEDAAEPASGTADEDPKPVPTNAHMRKLEALAAALRVRMPTPRTDTEAVDLIEAYTQRLEARRVGSQAEGNERY